MSIRRHTLLNVAGVVLPMGVGLATVPVYLACIGPERYGVLAVLWVVAGYFGVLGFGFGPAVSQRMARFANGDPQRRAGLLWTAVLSTLGMGMVASGLFWLLSNAILSLIQVSPEIRRELSESSAWMGAALPILLLTSVFQGALTARLKFFELNSIAIVGAVTGYLLPLAAAVLGFATLQHLIPITLAPRALVLVLLIWRSCIWVPLAGRPAFIHEHFRELCRYGGWVSVTAFLSLLLTMTDRLVIAAMSGAKAVTCYSAPYELVSRISILSGSMATALFPRFASAGRAEGIELAERASQKLAVVMTPIVIVGLFFIKPFLTVWLGASLAQESAGVAETLLLGVWVNELVAPHYVKFMATDEQRIIVSILSIQTPIYILMILVGVFWFGIMGAAAVWSIRALTAAVALLYLNGALAKMLRFSAPYAVLIVAAACFVLNGNVSLVVRGVSCAMLVGVSLAWGRLELIHEVNSLLKGRGSQGLADFSLGMVVNTDHIRGINNKRAP